MEKTTGLKMNNPIRRLSVVRLDTYGRKLTTTTWHETSELESIAERLNDSLDMDVDEPLTHEEGAQIVATTTRLFNKINIHGKDRLDYSDLQEYVHGVYKVAHRLGFVTPEFDPVACELGFRELDSDNDGYVTFEDVV